MRPAFLKTTSVVAAFVGPLALGIAVAAPQAIPLVLGQKWAATVVPVQVLCLLAFVRAAFGNAGALLYAAGRPDYLAKACGVQVIVMAVMLVPATVKFGLMGTALAATVAQLAGLPVTLYGARASTQLSPVAVMRSALIPVACAAPLLLTVAVVQVHLDAVQAFVLTVAAGSVALLVSLALARRLLEPRASLQAGAH